MEVSRRIAKIVNFGLSYGLTSQGLALQAGISEDQAEIFLDTFFKRFPGIVQFRKSLWATARMGGNQWSNVFGRTRRMDQLTDPIGWKRRSAERRLIGSAIQGTAAELTKESMVRVSKRFKDEGLPAIVTNNIHDEIWTDHDPGCRTRVIEIMKTEMEDYPEFHPIPIVVDIESTQTNWADKQSVAA